MANTLISDFLNQSPFLFGGWDQGMFANGATPPATDAQESIPSDSSYEQEMRQALQNALQTEDMDWGDLLSVDVDREASSQVDSQELPPTVSIPALGIGAVPLLPSVEPQTLLAALSAFTAATGIPSGEEPVSSLIAPRLDISARIPIRLVNSVLGTGDWPAIPETAAFALTLKAPMSKAGNQPPPASAPFLFSAPAQDVLLSAERIVAALEGTAMVVTSVKATPIAEVGEATPTNQVIELAAAPGLAPEALSPLEEAPASLDLGHPNDPQPALPDFSGATAGQPGDEHPRDRNENARTEIESANNQLATNELIPGVGVTQAPGNTASPARSSEAPRGSLSAAASEQIQVLRQEATQRNPISHLVLELEGAGAVPVRLRLMNTSGQVRLEVHSPEADVRHALRSDLGDLMSRIERAGFQVSQSPAVPVARVAPADPAVAPPPRWVDTVPGPVGDTRATAKSEQGQMRDSGKGRERRGSGDQGVKR